MREAHNTSTSRVTASLSEIMFERLKDDIIAGIYAPGNRLTIDTLAHTYDVSPTPVREALSHLAGLGLVHRVGLKGFRVAPLLSHQEVEDLVGVRILLETEAIERAVVNDPSLHKKLAAALKKQEAKARKLTTRRSKAQVENIKAYFESDWAFHDVILEASGNQCLRGIVNDLSFSSHRMRQTVGAGTSDAELAIAEHQSIVDAVQTGDPQVARAAMLAHLEAVRERALSDSSEGEDTGKEQ